MGKVMIVKCNDCGRPAKSPCHGGVGALCPICKREYKYHQKTPDHVLRRIQPKVYPVNPWRLADALILDASRTQ